MNRCSNNKGLFRLFFVLLLLLLGSNTRAQDKPLPSATDTLRAEKNKVVQLPADSSTTQTADSSAINRAARNDSSKIGLRRALHSLIIPGWGQWQNHQLPKGAVFWGTITAMGLGSWQAQAQYKDYRAALFDAYNDEVLNPLETEYSIAQLHTKMDKARTAGNWLRAGALVLYAANAIDAYSSFEIRRQHLPHSPLKAATRSAALPGWGQAYNGKYWKIPLVYGALGVATYFLYDNLRWYHRFTDAYIYRYREDFSPYPAIANYDEATLLRGRTIYRRYAELSVLSLVVVYALQIVDATVDAHLHGFNVDDNLEIGYLPAGIGEAAVPYVGVKWTF